MPYFEVEILLFAHNFLILKSMIIITQKMENSMDNDSVQFLLKFRMEMGGIVGNRIDTDNKITRDNIPFAIVECNDISIIVMMQKFLVDRKDMLIGAELNAYVSYHAFLGLDNLAKP